MKNLRLFFLLSTISFLFLTSSCTKTEDTTPLTQDRIQVSDVFDLNSGNTTTLLRTGTPSYAIININSTGNADVNLTFDVIIDSSTGETRKLERNLQAGEAIVEEFSSLVTITATVLSPTSSAYENVTLNFTAVYVPMGGNNGMNGPDDILYGGPTCLEGDVENDPDYENDGICLWDKDILWQSGIPREIDMEITLTGTADISVFIEYSNGTSSLYNAAAGALPGHDQVIGEWHDVVKVSVLGSKGVDGCSCDYYYNICYQ